MIGWNLANQKARNLPDWEVLVIITVESQYGEGTPTIP